VKTFQRSLAQIGGSTEILAPLGNNQTNTSTYKNLIITSDKSKRS